jgi:hypothetical protein
VYNPADAGNPPPAPVPATAPPPPEAGEIPAAPRYQYLVSRLRNRQITMEEATELFAIQRQQVAVLLARTNALAAAAAVPAPSPRMLQPVARPAPPGAPPPPGLFPIEGLDLWGEGLLFLAVGAGLLAALAKRAQAPAPKSPSRPAASASGKRQS